MALVDRDDLRSALGLPPDPGAPGDGFTVDVDQVAAAAEEILTPFLTTGPDHSTHSACRAAGTHIAVELWQSRTAAGGQPTGLDFSPGPYRLSRYLIASVSGLLGPCRDVRGLVG